MEVSSGLASSSPAAVTSPRSLQTPPNLDNMTLTNEGNLINGQQQMSISSPKHGSGTLQTMSSPGSSIGRSSSVSPPGSALSLVNKVSYSTSQAHGHLPVVNGMSSSQLSRACVSTSQGLLSSSHSSHQLHQSLGYHRSLHHPASPPAIAADMTTNDCRLIDYKGAKIAAFLVHGDYLLCLPQAFELFLKHLVGGLHTVYTKLKRLDITPIVCNVEQVRILRGLGAIQPGVNRCKLLSCKDFDALYKDCTTARRCFSAGRELPHHDLAAAAASSLYGSIEKTSSLVGAWGDIAPSIKKDINKLLMHKHSSRPGRPPKRVPTSMVSLGNSGIVPSTASLLSKKSRLEQDYHPYENGHVTGERLEKAHLLQNGYGQQISTSHVLTSALSFMPLPHHGISSTPTITTATHSHGVVQSSRADTGRSQICNEVMSSTTNRSRDDRIDASDGKERLFYDITRNKDVYINGTPAGNGHSPVLNLSQNSSRGVGTVVGSTGGHNTNLSNQVADQLSGSDAPCYDNGDDDDYTDDDDDREDFSDHPDVTSTANGGTNERLIQHGSGQSLFPFVGGHLPLDSGGMSPTHQVAISSIETLLRNIQGLLKVAADNARQQERQINIEKAELKMEVLRERELRETLEKQLLEEQRTRILYQKRLKKEKRSRRRFQEQLESEVKKRAQYEEALRTTSADTLRLLNDTLAQELERERERNAEIQHENKNHDCPMSV